MCDEIDSKLKWVNKLILYHGHVARKDYLVLSTALWFPYKKLCPNLMTMQRGII